MISAYHDLSGSVNKGYYSSVYDFRNDVDTEIRTHNAITQFIKTPSNGDMAAFWSD